MEEQQEQPVVQTPTGEREWLASRLLRRQVVNVATLEPVGRVADVIFDPKRSQLAGLVIQSVSPPEERGFISTLGRTLGWRRDTSLVALDHIIALNGDVVMINTEPTRRALAHQLDRLPHLNEVCDLAILTIHGICVGSLTDLLLDHRGSAVSGYVVNPTSQGEEMLPLLDNSQELVQAAPDAAEDGAGESSIASPVTSHLRFIPASAHVQIGDALILLVAEVEPLQQQEIVVITSQTAQTAQTATPQS